MCCFFFGAGGVFFGAAIAGALGSLGGGSGTSVGALQPGPDFQLLEGPAQPCTLRGWKQVGQFRFPPLLLQGFPRSVLRPAWAARCWPCSAGCAALTALQPQRATPPPPAPVQPCMSRARPQMVHTPGLRGMLPLVAQADQVSHTTVYGRTRHSFKLKTCLHATGRYAAASRHCCFSRNMCSENKIRIILGVPGYECSPVCACDSACLSIRCINSRAVPHGVSIDIDIYRYSRVSRYRYRYRYCELSIDIDSASVDTMVLTNTSLPIDTLYLIVAQCRTVLTFSHFKT